MIFRKLIHSSHISLSNSRLIYMNCEEWNTCSFVDSFVCLYETVAKSILIRFVSIPFARHFFFLFLWCLTKQFRLGQSNFQILCEYTTGSLHKWLILIHENKIASLKWIKKNYETANEKKNNRKQGPISIKR